jgi:hypothetical protein
MTRVQLPVTQRFWFHWLVNTAFALMFGAPFLRGGTPVVAICLGVAVAAGLLMTPFSRRWQRARADRSAGTTRT